MSKAWLMKRRSFRKPNTKSKTPRVRVAVALLGPEGLLLVRHQKRERSYWLIPGGGLEFGESMREAAHRELLEETGLEVEVGSFLMAAESLAPDRTRHVVHVIFRGQVSGGTLRLGDEHMEPHERRIVEVRWVPLEEVRKVVMHPPFGEQIITALQTPDPERQNFLDNLWVD
jgi:ADP-ribose pyrophosphatase YjhB (NUDIX family)